MTDLSSWLLERIAEDEAVALAAIEHSGERWDFDENPDSGVAVVTTTDEFRDAYRGERGYLWDWEDGYIGCAPESAAHIARHDPARALAQCAAYRAIIEVHHPIDNDPEPFCWNCDTDEWPCPTLRALASVWVDHPDHDPAWRPSDE